MATLSKMERAIEKARKARVDAYKKAIKNMEEEDKLFYENQLKRQNISDEEFAKACKTRSERYANHSKEVLNVAYMTEEEKLSLSREYMLKSEEALTEHYVRMAKIDEKRKEEILKARREQSEASMDASYSYVSGRNYSDDWVKAGDDPIDAFNRVRARLQGELSQGIITEDEYSGTLKAFGSEMYSDRIANSDRWLRHETEMNRLSTEEYIAGLYRMQSYTQAYYDAGIISTREYYDGMQSLEERLFDKKKELHQRVLSQAEEEKKAVDKTANAKIDSLEREYRAKLALIDEENTEEELDALKAQEKIYASAETKEGKEKLADIRKDIDRIEDDMKRAELEAEFESEKEDILYLAEKKKNRIDKRAKEKATDFGLYYDEDAGYQAIADARGTFTALLAEQEAYSTQSKTDLEEYGKGINTLFLGSTATLAEGILNSFTAFAMGVEAIKNRIFSDVEAVNSLDFSRFGVSSSPIKGNITYNDYGDKNITGVSGVNDYFSGVGNLMARGGRI